VTYLVRRVARSSRSSIGPRGRGLSGLGDLGIDPSGPLKAINDALSGALSNNADQAACLAQANTATANIDAVWQQIAQQWKPSGNFTVADLNTASSAVYQMLEESKIAVIVAPNTAADRDDMVNQALDDIKKYEDRGIPFQQAVTQAQAQGIGYVTTEGFKDWVLGALTAASSAFATRTVLDCNTTWLDQAWQYILGVRDTVLAIVEAVATTAIDAGAATLHAASTIVTNLKWIGYGAVALGALYLWTKFGKTRSPA